jgi:hypothetical protein
MSSDFLPVKQFVVFIIWHYIFALSDWLVISGRVGNDLLTAK